MMEWKDSSITKNITAWTSGSYYIINGPSSSLFYVSKITDTYYDPLGAFDTLEEAKHFCEIHHTVGA